MLLAAVSLCISVAGGSTSTLASGDEQWAKRDDGPATGRDVVTASYQG